jgi:tubulin-folding cofactor B
MSAGRFLTKSIFVNIQVTDTRPASARLNLTDTSEVEKWVMPEDQYSRRSDSVLAWKKRNQLGRFDPNKSESEAKEHQRLWNEVIARGIEVGKRCRVGGDGGRRGTVRYVGLIPEIPNGDIWVGFEADEPTGRYAFLCIAHFGFLRTHHVVFIFSFLIWGYFCPPLLIFHYILLTFVNDANVFAGKNDGSVGGKSYFSCNQKHGSFIRPDRVEMGDFPELNDLEDLEEM